MNIREALLAMGYQEESGGQWLKPIGYQCFAFCEEQNLWSNWFKSAHGKVELWDKKELVPTEDCLNQLKEVECWTKINVYCQNSSFELRRLDL